MRKRNDKLRQKRNPKEIEKLLKGVVSQGENNKKMLESKH
jgi:hypothetical protein